MTNRKNKFSLVNVFLTVGVKKNNNWETKSTWESEQTPKTKLFLHVNVGPTQGNMHPTKLHYSKTVKLMSFQSCIKVYSQLVEREKVLAK